SLAAKGVNEMTLIYRRCAGMDVHQKSISVCVRIRTARDHFETETAVFRSFTYDLEQMAKWLKERKVRDVAMESTGLTRGSPRFRSRGFNFMFEAAKRGEPLAQHAVGIWKRKRRKAE